MHEEPGRTIRHSLPGQLSKPPIEIIIRESDGEIRGALDDTHAELAQRGSELGGTVDVDRFNAHTAFSEILFCQSRRQAKAGPITGHGAGR
ncbi:hypothetical protein GALL_539660 [mine drainage metagenome]|uniref:Uncharacterized protein n=1 Tax=mine drainage metagenome TaxID=410659 RepID=A0A1J5PGU1_9ZZZZ